VKSINTFITSTGKFTKGASEEYINEIDWIELQYGFELAKNLIKK
jgi:hypothetical protein